MGQSVADVAILGQVDVTSRTNGHVRIERVVLYQESKKVKDLLFPNSKILVRRRIACCSLSDDQHVQLFRQTRKSRTQTRDVLGKRDDVAPCLVLTAFADPHEKTR